MKIPVFTQKSSSDCGPVCVQMISAYYGKHYNIKTLKDYCNVTKIGSSIGDVIRCSESIGLHAASISVNMKEARRIPSPAILFFPRGHFVVLEKISQRKNKFFYTIVDPDYGRVKLEEQKLFEEWFNNGIGFGVIVEPKIGFKEINPETNPLEKVKTKEIFTYIKSIVKKYKLHFWGIGILTLIALITNWAMPLLLQRTIDDGIMQKDMNIVWLMLICQFAFFIGLILSDNITQLIKTKVSIKINLDFIARYFIKLFKLPMQFFDSSFRSDLIQRLGDMDRINGFVTNSMLSMVLIVLNIIVFSIILAVTNYKIFLVFILLSIVSIIYNSFFLKKRKALDYSFFFAESERRNHVYEMVMGMHEIKINNAQDTRISFWRKLEQKINALKIKSSYLDYYMSSGSDFLGRLRNIVLTGMCAYFVIQGDITLGMMTMISFVLGQLSGPVQGLIEFSRVLQDVHLSYGRMAEIYDKPDENNEDKTSLDNYQVKTGIKLQKISFRYPGTFNDDVIKDLSISLPVGKKTAIVGLSGSGKTTLLKLLLGFYYPTGGSLLIDNYNIKDVNADSWRSKCGVVMQDGYIFSGSIGHNIALSDENPDLDKLAHSAKLARIDEYVNRLPMRYNTRIGETGMNLSGGEKQRLHIARAIYKNPEFLFLDEATSSLDSINEAEIMKNLDQFREGKTVVIIAHRLSTIKNADNIILLENGTIVEQGTHSELLKKEGAYYQFVKHQLA